MKSSSFVRTASLAGRFLAVCLVLEAPLAASAITVQPSVTMDISPASRYCPVRADFDPTVKITDFGSDAHETLTYHWEYKGKRYPDHTDTVDMPNPNLHFTDSENELNHLFHWSTGTSVSAIKGVLRLVVTKPVHAVYATDPLEIWCHN